jgi:hypothetical protein
MTEFQSFLIQTVTICGSILDPGMHDVRAVSDMLKPYDGRLMRSYPISSRVNHVANDDAGCSAPVEASPTRNRLFFPESTEMIDCIEDEINRAARLSLVSKNLTFRRFKNSRNTETLLGLLRYA